MKLILNKKRKIKKTICGQEFSLVPYINLSQKEFILNKLFEYYEENSEDSFVNLISGFRAILDALIVKAITDIETDGLEYDDMLSSGLIELIRKSVINYEEIMQDSFYFLQLNLLGKLLPNEKSLMESFSEIPKMFESMSPEQQKNLEMVVKASLANSASNAILGGIKGGE
jgi:hypothetical protein